jgi:Flp pilus assembly CpaE family ATPase
VSVEGLSKKKVEERLDVQVVATIPYMQENFSLANNLHVPIGDKYPNYTATMALREAVVKLEKRLQEVPNVQAR